VSAFGPGLGSGRALRTYTCVRALAALGPLDLAYVPHDGAAPSAEYQAIPNVEFHEIRPSRGARRARTYLRERLRGVPAEYAKGVSAELIEVSERLALEPHRGRVVCGDLHASASLLHLGRTRPIVYNAHNIESSFSHQKHNRWPWTRVALRSFERRLLATAAESWMVSKVDLATAATLAPQARLRYVPNVVDVEAITPMRVRPQGRTLVMIGDFTYAPNRTALNFLSSDIMPLVWREMSDARLKVVGRGLDPGALTDPRVEYLGFIDEIGDAYAGADCIVVPLVEGAGTPLKFVEGLAYQVPIVATSLAARGLEAVDGVHFRQADDAAAFSDAVLGMLRDRDGAAAFAREGRLLAEREYSISALVERIAA
jgi:glycosyltransferase involved in cell wall biosynthesis